MSKGKYVGEKPTNYIRIGTQYYKITNVPLLSGDVLTNLTKWNKETILIDHDDKFLIKIPTYDNHCIIPEHKDYKQVIGNSYNKYEPFAHKATPGNCEKSKEFVKHIFGDQFEKGYDYLKVLYEKPFRKLPILCLVSSSRRTGKTTFLNWLKEIFKGNMTLNTESDFRSQFNSDWATKLIIAIDEAMLNRQEDSEKLKNLSTSKHYKMEAKNVERLEIPFFGKFIICSNKETDFVKIDNEEVRYWVRKIPVLADRNDDLLKELVSEIPAFLHFLENREFTTKGTDRSWFHPEEIETEALLKLKHGNRSTLELEIITIIKEILEDFDLTEVRYTLSDLMELLRQSGGIRNLSKRKISEVLSNSFGLEQTHNSKYTHVSKDSSGEMLMNPRSGRYYEFTYDMFFDKFVKKSVKTYLMGYESIINKIDDVTFLEALKNECNTEYGLKLSCSEFKHIVLELNDMPLCS